MAVDVRHLVRRPQRLRLWTRCLLLCLVLGWGLIFAVAVFLDPYDENGTARRMETHRQLGLPPCTFRSLSGLPCPSCGMTTSFSLLVRGDLWHSAQANYAGTALAAFGLLFIPWGILSALSGRLCGIRSLELTLFRLCMIFLILLLSHWALALWWARWP